MVEKHAKDLIRMACEAGVYDIYILPYKSVYKVYFREMRGRREIEQITDQEAKALISHFKYFSGMTIGEHRRTQLGACSYVYSEGERRRLRLSSVGDFENRESLVVRLLHDASRQQPIFWETTVDHLAQKIDKRGLYLFSGGVGSGKTTLMYSLAKACFRAQQVITIEDPVELIQPEFLQLQLNPLIGNDYETLIKLSLRHMPQLVIVGEIRDQETAKAVVRASMTGYTVFSTLHARSIAGINARLLDLGVQPWELEQALSGVFYQRMIGGKGGVIFANEAFQDYDVSYIESQFDRYEAKAHLATQTAD